MGYQNGDAKRDARVGDGYARRGTKRGERKNARRDARRDAKITAVDCYDNLNPLKSNTAQHEISLPTLATSWQSNSSIRFLVIGY